MAFSVVLSGGAGTRVWPVSREGYSKPLMKLVDGKSLLFKTYRRAAAASEAVGVRADGLMTVTNYDYYFMSEDQFAAAQLGDSQTNVFLLEPVGRNIAPAVALAAHCVVDQYGPDALMLVIEVDRLISDQVRPWGTYTVVEEGSRFKIKRIEVKPGASLSVQMHHHRSEH